MPRNAKKVRPGAHMDQVAEIYKGTPDAHGAIHSWSLDGTQVSVQVDDDPSELEYNGEVERYEQMLEVCVQADVPIAGDGRIAEGDVFRWPLGEGGRRYEILGVRRGDRDGLYAILTCGWRQGDDASGEGGP